MVTVAFHGTPIQSGNNIGICMITVAFYGIPIQSGNNFNSILINYLKF